MDSTCQTEPAWLRMDLRMNIFFSFCLWFILILYIEYSRVFGESQELFSVIFYGKLVLSFPFGEPIFVLLDKAFENSLLDAIGWDSQTALWPFEVGFNFGKNFYSFVIHKYNVAEFSGFVKSFFCLLNDFSQSTRIAPIAENEMKNLRTAPTANFCKLSAWKYRENEKHSVETVENYIIFLNYHTSNVT